MLLISAMSLARTGLSLRNNVGCPSTTSLGNRFNGDDWKKMLSVNLFIQDYNNAERVVHPRIVFTKEDSNEEHTWFNQASSQRRHYPPYPYLDNLSVMMLHPQIAWIIGLAHSGYSDSCSLVFEVENFQCKVQQLAFVEQVVELV